MSVRSLTPEARRLLAADASVSRSSAVVSLSLLVTALLGATQGIILVFIVGEGEKTDAFLAAYSLYLALTLFGASLRGSVIPMFGTFEPEGEFRARASEVLGRIVLIGLVLIVPLVAISPVMGRLLTPDLSGPAQRVAVLSLVVLAPAAYLQLHAAALSALLSAVRRFDLSALVYVGAGVTALLVSAMLLALVGVLGMGFGLLTGAVVLAGAHAVYVRSFGLRMPIQLRWLGERRQYTLAILLLAGSATGIAAQLNLAISLSQVSREPNAITAYSYAFFLVSLMLTVSSLPIGLVTMPDLIGRLATGGAHVADEHFERVAPYAFAVLAPLIGGLIAFGKPVLEAVLGTALSDHTIGLLYDVAVILCTMAVPMSLLYIGGAVTLAMRRHGRLLGVGAAMVAVNAALVIPLASSGPRAVAAGQSVAAAVGTIVLLWATFDRRWLAVTVRALRRSSPAFALALVFLAARAPLGSHPALALVVAAALAAAAAYAALAALLWPAGSAPFLELIRRPKAPATP